jgi:hypothetical protein
MLGEAPFACCEKWVRETTHVFQSVQNDSVVTMVAIAHAALRWS